MNDFNSASLYIDLTRIPFFFYSNNKFIIRQLFVQYEHYSIVWLLNCCTLSTRRFTDKGM